MSGSKKSLRVGAFAWSAGLSKFRLKFTNFVTIPEIAQRNARVLQARSGLVFAAATGENSHSLVFLPVRVPCSARSEVRVACENACRSSWPFWRVTDPSPRAMAECAVEEASTSTSTSTSTFRVAVMMRGFVSLPLSRGAPGASFRSRAFRRRLTTRYFVLRVRRADPCAPRAMIVFGRTAR